jgi:hypothetical protein
VGEFNTPLSSIYKSSRPKKINKETTELTGMIEQMDKTDIYNIFHPAVA